MDGSAAGPPGPGALQARALERAPLPLQGMKVKRESEVAQSCPTLSGPMDGSAAGPPGPGALQAGPLERASLRAPLPLQGIKCNRHHEVTKRTSSTT